MKPIFTSLSPNIESDDLSLIWQILLSPQNWQDQESVKELEKKFSDYLGVKYAFAFNSGRSAFWAILESLNLPKKSQVLIQGFTCNAVVNPILWSGLKPIYIDIDKATFNIDPLDLEKKITPQSKVVVVQHTFGLPADLKCIQEICQKHNLILIEDCAHSLGAKYQNKLVGTFGKAAFLSFGRDKVISSVYGGLAVSNDPELAKKIEILKESLALPSKYWIFQQLMHPILTSYGVIPLYKFGEVGRFMLLFLQKIGLLSKAVHDLEKQGQKPNYIPQKMPGALARMCLNQFLKLDKFNHHRNLIAKIYEKELKGIKDIKLPQYAKDRIYWRYPILVFGKNPNQIIEKARKEKIFLDDGWRGKVIVPPDTDQKAMGYQNGLCSVAERVADQILNLPTHINISSKEALKIVRFLKEIF